MKKLAIVLTVLILSGGPIFSQDLLPLGRDLDTLLEKLGEDVVPYLQQNALAGEGIGMAELSEGSKFWFATSLGATLSNGLGTFLDDESAFELLDVNGMLQTAVDGTAIESYYNKAKSFFPYPIMRVAFGFRSFADTELIFMFSIFPQLLTDTVAGSVKMEGVTLNWMNAGVRLRKALMSDQGGFPAISLGVGYSFSSFNIGYALPEDFSQDVTGFPLSIQGDLGIHTMLNSLGVELALSKRLGVFIPFVRVSPWYHWIRYTGEVKDFEATAGGESYIAQGGKDPSAEKNIYDLDVLFAGGFDIKLGKFAILAEGSYSLDSRAFGAGLGMRFQF